MSEATPAEQVRKLAFHERNYYCIDCDSTKGERFVDLVLQVFMCDQCAEGHRDLRHTVKSIVETGWSSAEVKELESRGNAKMQMRVHSIGYKLVEMPSELSLRRKIIVKKYTELRNQEKEAQVKREELEKLKENLGKNKNKKMIKDKFPELSQMHEYSLASQNQKLSQTTTVRVDEKRTRAPSGERSASEEAVAKRLDASETAPDVSAILPDQKSNQVETVALGPWIPLQREKMRRNTLAEITEEAEAAARLAQKNAPAEKETTPSLESMKNIPAKKEKIKFPPLPVARRVTQADLLNLSAAMDQALYPHRIQMSTTSPSRRRNISTSRFSSLSPN